MASAVPIKKGVLQKRSQGKSAIGQLLPNWQSRLFVLTDVALTYYDEAGKEAKDSIPIATIIAVEPVTPAAFLKANVFQVITPASTLYVFCEAADDYDQWILALRKLVAKTQNPELATTHHPGHCDGKRWNCCSDPPSNTRGCKPCFDYSTLQ
eukprot:m.221518 g.221518  ORF g.221518 m.221518 type:complete len:153 (+) comp10602_c0_seq1:45-503(+)